MGIYWALLNLSKGELLSSVVIKDAFKGLIVNLDDVIVMVAQRKTIWFFMLQ